MTKEVLLAGRESSQRGWVRFPERRQARDLARSHLVFWSVGGVILRAKVRQLFLRELRPTVVGHVTHLRTMSAFLGRVLDAHLALSFVLGLVLPASSSVLPRWAAVGDRRDDVSPRASRDKGVDPRLSVSARRA